MCIGGTCEVVGFSMEYADGNPVIFWNADKFQNIKIVFFRFSRDLNIDLFCDKMCVCVCVCVCACTC